MAITLINAATPASGVNGATTAGISTVGAKLLSLAVTYIQGSTFTVGDNSSGVNTFTPRTAREISSSTSAAIYDCVNPTFTSGSHTFNITGASCFGRVNAAAWAGTGGSPFDVQNGFATATVTSPQSNGSVTPAATDDLALILCGGGGAGAPAGANPWAISTPSFTALDNSQFVGGTNFGTFFGYLIGTGVSAINPSVAWTPGSAADIASSLVLYKASSFQPAWAVAGQQRSIR